MTRLMFSLLTTPLRIFGPVFLLVVLVTQSAPDLWYADPNDWVLQADLVYYGEFGALAALAISTSTR